MIAIIVLFGLYLLIGQCNCERFSVGAREGEHGTHQMEETEEDEDVNDDEKETGNGYRMQPPTVTITKHKKAIPKRLTRDEIEKSLIEKFS